MTIFHGLQRQLVPALTEELGQLSAVDQPCCEVSALTQLGRFTGTDEGCGEGRPPGPRIWLAHACIAKHVSPFPPTAALLEALPSRPTLRRLCGWESAGDLPSEPTFRRAFATFAQAQLPQRIPEPMVRVHAGNKLVGHISRAATASAAPERPAPTPAAPAPPAPAKRGRPQTGEGRPPAPPKRLALQPTRTRADPLADRPARWDVGCKRNSKGHPESWIGYQLHLDTMDGDLPVSAVLTSASVHDRQAAIPLAPRTAQRVTSLADLMDRAYAAPPSPAFRRQVGQVPIIDPNPRGGEKIPLAPAQAQRFKERSASERGNRLLKERYGGRWGRVRGASKVMCPWMFGLVALTASALLARLGCRRPRAPPAHGGPENAPCADGAGRSVSAAKEKWGESAECGNNHAFAPPQPSAVTPVTHVLKEAQWSKFWGPPLGIGSAPSASVESACRNTSINFLIFSPCPHSRKSRPH